MAPVRNPFAPGAGIPPPDLAGRDELREVVRVARERLRAGRPTKSIVMVGLRGVGKTVLLDRMREDAEAAGIHTIRVEAPEVRSLPALLAPQLRLALLRLSANAKSRALAQRASRGLAGFAKALKVKFGDIEVGLDLEPEPGLADNGDLEQDLQALLEVVGAAAKRAGTALVLFIDEIQYVEEEQLAALITALHRTAQSRLPIMLVGAGLPQLRGQMGRAKSYAERLFADASPITDGDVRQASRIAIAALDQSFLRVRFNRLTPLERRYLRAIAELGPGPHRSGTSLKNWGRSVFPGKFPFSIVYLEGADVLIVAIAPFGRKPGIGEHALRTSGPSRSDEIVDSRRRSAAHVRPFRARLWPHNVRLRFVGNTLPHRIVVNLQDLR